MINKWAMCNINMTVPDMGFPFFVTISVKQIKQSFLGIFVKSYKLFV